MSKNILKIILLYVGNANNKIWGKYQITTVNRV